MPSSKNPLVIKEFKGEMLTDILSISDVYQQSQVPFEYSLNNENMFYLKKGGLTTRPGLNHLKALAMTGQVIQFWRIDNLNGTDYVDRFLILTWDGATGRMYDTNPVTATNPVMSVTGMKYAYVVNAFGRMYISPWQDWASPLASAYIWIYNDKYASGARLTMCVEPTPGTMAVAAAAAGTDPACTVGLHLISVVYETDSGFISTCPTSHIKAPLQVTVTTGQKINVTNVPTFPGSGFWPAGMVVARHIIMSKVAANYNNNGFDSYEPFFVQKINDNITTSTTITMPDSGMVESAKHLVNQSQSGVRAHVSMAVYKSRMVYLGSRSYSGGDTFGLVNSVVYSPVNQPEQVGNVLNDGFRVIVGGDFSGKVMVGTELNGTFYIFKEDSTFAHVADDENDPSDWAQPSLVDAAKGAFPFGVSNVGNNPSALMDNYLLVAGNHGLSLFNGSFAQNSVADAIWARFNTIELRWTKVVVEPIRKLIFMKFGDPAGAVGANGSPLTYIYFSDYYYGLQNLRWGKFMLPVDYLGAHPQIYAYDILLRQPSIVVSYFKALYSLLTILSLAEPVANNVILSENNDGRDWSTLEPPIEISWKYETGYTPNEQGEVNEFGPIKIRANSRQPTVSKTITIKKGIIDDAGSLTTVGSLIVSDNPKKYYSLPMNETNEQMRLEISGTGVVIIQALMLFMKRRALERPRP